GTYLASEHPGAGEKHQRLDQWIYRCPDLQWLAARDTAGGPGVRPSLSHRGPGKHCRCVRPVPAVALQGKAPRAQPTAVPGGGSHRRCARLSAIDRVGVAVRDFRALHRVPRLVATSHRSLRCPAWWRTAPAGILVFFRAGQPAGGGIRHIPGTECSASGRHPDAAGRAGLRPGLCRRGEAIQDAGRLAGDFLGAGAIAAGDAAAERGPGPLLAHGHQHTRLVEPGVCIAVQHADRFRVLVSRVGPGRDRRRGTVAAVAAVFRLSTGGDLAARAGQPGHAGGHRGGDPLRGRREEILQV
ncbi:Permease of the drug/metabolite transporter (DMT) superfamily, partial [Pseudomonas sp. FEN]